MINTLVRQVSEDEQFQRLLEVFNLEEDFNKIGKIMKTVYAVLKSEEKIIKTFEYNSLLDYLRQNKFFTKHEEDKLLSNTESRVENIIEILKDKDALFFKKFSECLEELEQDSLITPITFPRNKIKDCLKMRYANSSFSRISELDLPLLNYVNLALIEVSEDDHKKNSTFFDYHSLLLKQKASYTRKLLDSYSEIVAENCRVVLIQGYPGSGKTCLAKQLCTKWANGELLQTFSYVIFLQLRDETIANASSLKPLIESQFDSSELPFDKIYSSHGKGLLLILEGWDELPETKQRSSLFTRLISGNLLFETKIIVTSRPSAVRSLEFTHIHRRIEILGLTEKQIALHIAHYFCEHGISAELIQHFNSELDRPPLLKSFVFVPINLSVSLYVFKSNDFKLPATFTDMYKQLTLNHLQHNLKRKSNGSVPFDDLSKLPPDLEEMLIRLSKMAYDNLLDRINLTFNATTIRKYFCNSSEENLANFDANGLLQLINHKHGFSVTNTYEFLHRTLQEFLAAWYISKQNSSFQTRKMQYIFNKKEFEMIWIFYGGLTKFEHITLKQFFPNRCMLKMKMISFDAFSWFLRKNISNFFVRLASVSGIIDKFWCGKQYSHNLSCCISREFQATLIVAVMEAQNSELCKYLAESYLFNHKVCWLSVPESAATAQIFSALSYCIKHSGKMWMLQSKLFDENMARYLSKQWPCCVNKTCNGREGTVGVIDTDCSQSPISGIPAFVRGNQLNDIQWLLLSNSTHANDSFMLELMKALEVNASLKMLHLVGCNVTSRGLEAIAVMLQRNRTLEWIGLANNFCTLHEENIIMLLETIENHNDKIFMLFLDHAFYSSENVKTKLLSINHTRQQKKVQTLNLTLLDCFNSTESCQRIFNDEQLHLKVISYFWLYITLVTRNFLIHSHAWLSCFLAFIIVFVYTTFAILCIIII